MRNLLSLLICFLLYGSKASAQTRKLNKNFRLGVTAMQTARLSNSGSKPDKELFYPSQNYSVFALQQKVFARSNIGVILVNRQAFGTDSISKFRYSPADYNRLAGIDYNLASRNGQWTGKFFHHMVFDGKLGKPASSQGGWLNYSTRKTSSWIGVTNVGKDFNPEVGFVPRKDFLNLYTELSYFFYPKKGKINFVQPIIHYSLYLDSLQQRMDHNLRIGSQIKLQNTGDIYIMFFQDYTRLLYPFNPAQNEGKVLEAGTDYHYKYLVFYYLSDLRKPFSWMLYSQSGQFFNGHLYQFSGFLNRKIQPWGIVGINFSTTFVRLPAPYSNNNIFAIGPKAELSFSRSLFITTLVQYNSQNRNLNFYGRLQWRFRPMSDLYVVYTNNQQTDIWKRQDQGLVIKFVYWL